MQKEYNTKKYVVNSSIELKNRIKKQKEGMAKMQFVKQVKQMDQKYEEVLHSATRLGQACGHRLLYTSTGSPQITLILRNGNVKPS